MGNTEGMLREISEAVRAAGALITATLPWAGSCQRHPSASQCRNTQKKNHLSSLVQNRFVNLFCNNTLKAIRMNSLQGKELQKMKKIPKVDRVAKRI